MVALTNDIWWHDNFFLIRKGLLRGEYTMIIWKSLTLQIFSRLFLLKKKCSEFLHGIEQNRVHCKGECYIGNIQKIVSLHQVMDL